MKNKLLRAMDLIDEKYIEEADPRRAKPLKKIKRLLAARTVAAVACLCLLSMLTVTLICPFSMPSIYDDISDCSTTYYFGNAPTGVIVKPAHTFLNLKKVTLDYGIQDFPMRQISREETVLSYTPSLKISYELYNSYDRDVSAKMLLPLGKNPHYFYRVDSNADTPKYDITLNGEAVEKTLRHTYTEYYDNYADGENYESYYQAEYKKLCDTYAEHDFFAPNTAVTKYTYEISDIGEYVTDDLYLITEWINNSYVSRYYFPHGIRKNSTDLKSKSNLCLSKVKNGQEIVMYVAGVAPQYPPEWKCYDAPKDGKEVSCTVSLTGTEVISFEELVLSTRYENSEVSETDWYNATIQQNEESSNEIELLPSKPDVDHVFLRWYEFEVPFSAYQEQTLEVTLPAYPTIHEGFEPYTYSYEFNLASLKSLNRNRDTAIEVNINTPYHVINRKEHMEDESEENIETYRKLNDFKQTENGYTLTLEGFPNYVYHTNSFPTTVESKPLDLEFELCIVPEPKHIYYGEKMTFTDFLLKNATTIFLNILAVGFTVSVSLIVINVKKKRRRERYEANN